MNDLIEGISTKEFFYDYVVTDAKRRAKGAPLRVLELGCGTAPYAPYLLNLHPDIEYVGIEPFTPSYEKAKTRLMGESRAKVFHQLGYDEVVELPEKNFDVVISISVLEHVKQLERFIALGAKYAKPSALVVHRYDLGHALYPGSLKERFQVLVGNHFPQLLPEHKFVRYVPMVEVVRFMQKHHQLAPHRYAYHQVPDLKTLDKTLRGNSLPTDSLTEIFEWEMEHSETFAKLPLPNREYLFPAVAVWGRQA